MKNCIFAGTFDPITVGHKQMIKECSALYDNVFVVIGVNNDKSPLFCQETRKKITKKALSDLKNVKVFCYSEIRDYGKFITDNGIEFYVRGIRNSKDYEYEKQAEEINAKLYPSVKTVYIQAKKGQEEISSSLIRELLKANEDLSDYLPDNVKEDVVEAYKNLK